MIRMGVGWGAWLGTLSPSVCCDGQKYIEAQSVCVETAVWQHSETAGGCGGGEVGGVLLLETGIASPNTKLHILGRQQQKRRQERDYKTPVTTPAP